MEQKIIFAGTPDFAAASLQALLDAGIRPCAVYTQPDRPAGRGHHLTPSAVKTLALSHNLDVRTPDNFKNEADIKAFEDLHADLCIVVAYGIILPQRILGAPRLGCINVHGSLLPEYRGAAPIQRALLDGKRTTGITIMKLVSKLDAGDMLATAELTISENDTSGSLFDKLAKLGAQTLIHNLGPILSGTLRAIPQDEKKVTYAAKITKDMSTVDFSQNAHKVDLQIRGLNPWPIATATLDNVRYKLFKASVKPSGKHEVYGKIIGFNHEGIEVACAQDSIVLKVIQAPGKGQVNAADLARSCPQKFEGKRFD